MIPYALPEVSKKLIPIFLVLISIVTSSAQVIDEKVFSKIVVPRKQTYLVTVDTLEVDTLRMEDRSTLRFTKDIVLTVHNAFIGSACEFNSSGAKGERYGKDGVNGKHLTIQILFKELNGLKINTSGGDGGTGSPGQPGTEGVSGGDGTNGYDGGNGGNGGDAGDIKLYYMAEGFIPLLEGPSNRAHTINFIYHGGSSGSGGYGGRGGPAGNPTSHFDSKGKIVVDPKKGKDGFSGKKGYDGLVGKDGKLIFKRID